ncbi:MAG TPA: MFS transporter [Lacunisphaera sp.]|jgi:OPA family glycerol-3-phosphate transporter-like MFS transporter|nr:MFS transporter [Lacunisphaera sp.]
MDLALVFVVLLVVIGVYFYNNPMRHGPWFLSRRFINWFPLGMSYSFLYMGRYNLAVAKNAFGALMSNEDFGLIFAAGTVVYAFSFLVNGPLVDKIGGKKGIIISVLGAAGANTAMGIITWVVLTGRTTIPLFWPFVVLYALNMYFQSYGAVSIIKVKANWFHVRERGVFGAIFGTLISFGVYFAFDWGQTIVNMTKVAAEAVPNGLSRLLREWFVPAGATVDATWAVFFVPAIILVGWAVLDLWLIKETPEDAGFPYLDTHDASSGHMQDQYTTLDLLKKVFCSPLMLMLGGVELTAGVLRNGIMQWYLVFAKQVPQPGAEAIIGNWGLLLCLFGIVGGFAGGLVSDKFFQSRRGPPAAIFSAFMLMMAAVMSMNLFKLPFLVGVSSLLIVAAVTGVHSLMSGTAAADFGGRKATATCSGLIDGCVYLGSSVQSVCVGFLTGTSWSGHSWQWWPIFLMPFALAGGIIAWRIWNELPAATRKYIAEHEAKQAPAGHTDT